MKELISEKTKFSKQNRVAVIGCEYVTSTNIYSLLLNGAAEEIVLIDVNSDKILGAVNSLRNALPLDKPTRIWAGDYADARNADIAVITAGIEPKSYESKLQFLERKVYFTRGIIRKLMAAKFDGVILVTTNPVGILTQIALQESNLPPHKVLGSGIVFGADRMRAMFDKKPLRKTNLKGSFSTKNAKKSEPSTWCAACVNDQPLVDFCNPNCPEFPAMQIRIQRNAPVTIQRKSETATGVGSCVSRICEAILRDERAILPVSAMTDGEYGISDVYINLPCVVGRGGFERIVELPLDETEQENLLDTAALMKFTLGKLNSGAAFAVAH